MTQAPTIRNNISLKISCLFLIGLLINGCQKELAPRGGQASAFMKFFGSYLTNKGLDVAVCPDGGYLVVGFSETENSNNLLAVKTDANGNPEWQFSPGTPQSDEAVSVLVLDDGYLIAGSADKELGTDQLQSQCQLTKLSTNGTLQWQKTYGTSTYNERVHSMVLSSNSQLLFIGTTDAPNTTYANPRGTTDFFMLKLSLTGDSLAAATFGGSGTDVATCGAALPNGNFVVGGYTESFESSGLELSNIIIMEVNSDCGIVDRKTWGGTQNDYCFSLAVVDDGYILAGSSFSNLELTEQPYLVKLSTNIHQRTWVKTLGNNQQGQLLDVVRKGNSLALAGTLYSSAQNLQNQLFIKTDLNGNQQTLVAYGSEGNDAANAIAPITNKGYVLTGTSELKGSSILTLFKVGEEGEGLN